MFGLSAHSCRAKENCQQIRAMQHIFNETAMQASTRASKRRAKVIRASHGPGVNLQSQAKERMKRIKENPKDYPKEPRARTKVPKAHARAKRPKRDRSILLIRRGFTRNGVRTKRTMVGVLMSGTMTGIVLDGVKIANKHTSHL